MSSPTTSLSSGKRPSRSTKVSQSMPHNFDFNIRRQLEKWKRAMLYWLDTFLQAAQAWTCQPYCQYRILVAAVSHMFQQSLASKTVQCQIESVPLLGLSHISEFGQTVSRPSNTFFPSTLAICLAICMYVTLQCSRIMK